MSFVHFIYMHSATPGQSLPQAEVDAVRAAVQTLPGLKRGLLYTPAMAKDFYTDDGPSPSLALQLYYDDLPTLEATLRAGGTLSETVKSLSVTGIDHQVMVGRSYPVTDATWQPDGDEPRCAYLVHYPGEAEDFNAWLDHYLDHHPQIMRNFPRIREIEIYTCADWRDTLGWTQKKYMQRNRLIFDSAAALEGALNSPVRHDMRADFEVFPKFTGSNIHYPMHLEDVELT